MKRFVPWLLIIIGLLVVAAVVRQSRNSGAANYQTATITRGPITQAVTATGTLNPVVNVQVGSQVSGNIAKLFVDFNSQVKAGQLPRSIRRFFRPLSPRRREIWRTPRPRLSSQK